MADAMNPMGPTGASGPTGPTNPTYHATPSPQARSSPATVQRPGLVTFAALMLILLGGFQLVFALVEFANAVWFSGTVYGDFSGRLWLWGIVDILLALVALFAGADLFRGGSFGRLVGLAIAGVSALRWFFYIPAEPATSILLIAIDVLIIYGLVAHTEYFDSAQLQ